VWCSCVVLCCVVGTLSLTQSVNQPSVLRIPWVYIVTSLFSKFSTDNIGLQQEPQIVIKFLVAEGVFNAEIHHRLAAVFNDDVKPYSVSQSCSRMNEFHAHFMYI